jgi:hypothetical protein
MPPTTRRRFLATLPLAGLAPTLEAGAARDSGSLTFSFITDVHHGTHGKDHLAGE